MLLRFQFKLEPESRILFINTNNWKMKIPRDKPLSSSLLFFFSYPSFFPQTKPHSDTFITTSILHGHGQTIINSTQELATSVLVCFIKISSHCRSWWSLSRRLSTGDTSHSATSHLVNWSWSVGRSTTFQLSPSPLWPPGMKWTWWNDWSQGPQPFNCPQAHCDLQG